MYCTNCGTQLADDAAFCTQCGQPQGQGAVPGAEQAAPTPQAAGLPRAALIGLIVAAFAICLALGLIFTTCARDSQSASGTSADTSTVSNDQAARASADDTSSPDAQAEDVARQTEEEARAAEEARKAEEEAARKAEELRAERVAAYDRILAAYQQADHAGDAQAGADSPIGINFEAMNPFVLENELVYTKYDVANDGEEELLIARKLDDNSTILYELVGYDAQMHEAKRIGDFTGYRNYCTVCEDGLLIFEGSGGANTGVRSTMRLPEYSTEPVLVERVEWDFEGDFDNVKYWYTDADNNTSECDEAKRDEIIANCRIVENYDWKPVADYVPEGGVAPQDESEQESMPAPDAATEAKEHVALDFATQYFTNTTVDPNDHTQVGSVGDWSSLVKAYIEPGSAAANMFFEEIESNPFGGLGAGCVVVGSEILFSEGNTVMLNLSVCGTQNPMPGWADPANARDWFFTCVVSDNNLIESYEISQTPPM